MGEGARATALLSFNASLSPALASSGGNEFLLSLTALTGPHCRATQSTSASMAGRAFIACSSLTMATTIQVRPVESGT